MTTLSPQRETQMMRSLERANTIRLGRAELKRKLRAGHVNLLHVLASQEAATATVLDALCWVPRFGSIRAVKVLNLHGISSSRRCGDLTDRQRELIYWSVVR